MPRRLRRNGPESATFSRGVRYPERKTNSATEKFSSGLRATDAADCGRQWMRTTVAMARPRSA